MTLIEIINKLKTYAEGQYNNPKVLVGSLYENLNTKELTYPCINIDNANAMKRENEIVYNFYIYYADRLSESGDNMLQIQSEATTALQLMLHKILDAGSINLDDYYNVVITPFKLKFTDVCAGAWMQVNVHAVGLDACDDGSQINTLYITANGNYDVEEYERVDVNVPTGITPTGTSEFTDNGTYDVTNDATAIVNIDKQALVDSGFTSGYTSGHTDGYNEGTADGFSSGYTSGYTDGYNSGYTSGQTVGFQSGYTSGYTSGSTDGFQNGYASGHTDGYNEGESAGFQDGYTSGHTDGVQSGFTSGWTTGYTSGFTEGYQSGHTDGYSEGYTSGHTDGVASGFTSGWTSGYTSGYTSGSTDGFQNGYASGHTDGYAEGQASVPLSSTAFTANDTYTKADGGWNSVTVNVPTVTTKTLTQAQYNALTVKDPMVIYLING